MRVCVYKFVARDLPLSRARARTCARSFSLSLTQLGSEGCGYSDVLQHIDSIVLQCVAAY